MSNAALRELYARDFRIVETIEEIKLFFGTGQSGSASDDDLVVDTASQIILTPAAAKKFSLVLNAVLDRHESLYGPVGSVPDSPRSQPRFQGGATPAVTDQNSGAHRLISLIDRLGVYYELEHSFKIFPGVVLGDRILLGFNYDELRDGDAADALLEVCRALGMPERFQKIYRERLPESNIILFGYEGNGKGGIYKAYLEFSGMFMTVSKPPGEPASSLFHLGFKWDAADNRKAALARYTGYPYIPVDEMLSRVRNQFYEPGATASYEVVRGLVERAAEKMPAEEFLYLEVEEEGNPRRSYDINMYRAHLTLQDLYPWLREACRIKGIGPETLNRFYAPMRQKRFGHVSGGHDREGRDFLTFYYGVAGR